MPGKWLRLSWRTAHDRTVADRGEQNGAAVDCARCSRRGRCVEAGATLLEVAHGAGRSGWPRVTGPGIGAPGSASAAEWCGPLLSGADEGLTIPIE